MNLMKRADARRLGLKRYFTGERCKYGHIAERVVSDGRCLLCRDRRSKEGLAKHNARLKEDAGYRKKVNARARKNWGKRFKINPESHRENVRVWRRNNLEKARRMACKAAKKQRTENRDRTNAHVRRAQLTRSKRRPPWADDEKILQVYTQARIMSELLGETWHVDHVIPLQGKFVSGLHVHTNLQILPGPENLRKHNCFTPMTWNRRTGWTSSLE